MLSKLFIFYFTVPPSQRCPPKTHNPHCFLCNERNAQNYEKLQIIPGLISGVVVCHFDFDFVIGNYSPFVVYNSIKES